MRTKRRQDGITFSTMYLILKNSRIQSYEKSRKIQSVSGEEEESQILDYNIVETVNLPLDLPERLTFSQFIPPPHT